MFDPDKPKLQDKGRGNSVYFEKAYWLTMEQIEAPEESINALLPLLYDSFSAGEATNRLRYIDEYLPEGQWRWPEFERQWPEMKRREYEGIKAHIGTVTDIKIAANIAGYVALRKIAQELLDDKVPAIKKMAEAEELCEKLKIQGHEIKALELFKRIALERNEKQFYDAKSEPPSQHEMREILVHRIHRLASGYERWQQIHEAEIFSCLKLSVFDPAKARPQCIAIEGKALHMNNPYWKDNFPPCERLDCRCWVTAKTERGVERDGLEIIDKI